LAKEVDAFCRSRRQQTTMNIQELIQKIYYQATKLKMIHRYKKDHEQSKILHEWIKKRILEGQKGRRREMQEMEARVEETRQFINYLKKL